jgi:hypothetical protein
VAEVGEVSVDRPALRVRSAGEGLPRALPRLTALNGSRRSLPRCSPNRFGNRRSQLRISAGLLVPGELGQLRSRGSPLESGRSMVAAAIESRDENEK